jgi:16S rRNA (cytosine1402-N4)-methyltransferase
VTTTDDATPAGHIAVLYNDVLDGLAVRPGGRYIDCTVGAGGHAAGILARSSPDGVLLGLDADPEAIARTGRRLAEFGVTLASAGRAAPSQARAILCQANFRDLAAVARDQGLERRTVDGILLDLGLSSPQLASPERGFSFALDGPLDMRFDPGAGPTAADIVNTASEEELGRLFFEYGEERAARRIARYLVAARARAPLQTTTQLAEIVRRAKAPPSSTGRAASAKARSSNSGYGSAKARRKHAQGRAASAGARIDPATQVFQALRIAVNRELFSLSAVLPAAVDLLRAGGRLAVISFHSLEDRSVKLFFRQEARSCICPPSQLTCTCAHQPSLRLVTRGALQAGPAEVAVNRRARSARLRVAERL